MEQQDLNAEYGRIFGVVHYPTLFDKDDSAYSELRKEIIDTPRLFTSTNKLPFESIYDFSIEQEIDCNRDYLEQKPGNTDLYDVIVGIRNHVTTIITGILSVLGGYKQATETSQFTNPAKNNHVFWITKAGRCRAYGYFDKETKNFYIGVGSLISIIDDSDYIASSSYRNRHRLIDKYGVNIGNYVKIKKDVKCRTAVAAARYTLGAMVNLDLWKDSQGKTLYEVYPDYFFR